jgi:hypothetical protein
MNQALEVLPASERAELIGLLKKLARAMKGEAAADVEQPEAQAKG